MGTTTKLNSKTLLNVISNIQERIKKEIPTINSGGCGWFAYYFYKTVYPLYGNLKLFPALDDGNPDLPLYVLFIQEARKHNYKHSKFIAPHHLLVVLDDKYFIDGTDTIAIKEEDIEHLKDAYYLSFGELITVVNVGEKEGAWNEEYKYQELNPKLETIIQEEVSKVATN